MNRIGFGRMVIAWVLASSAAALAADVGTAFTYQGRLDSAGQAADGQYDFQFRLFTGDWPLGFVVGSPVVLEDVEVVDGLFTVQLDFGVQFTGFARWLDVAVRPGASGGAFTSLLPRQELTPAPYASGLALPFATSYATATPLFAIDQTGSGHALRLDADAGNALNAATSAGGKAVYAQTTGGGIPIFGYNLGASGEAAFFRSESVSNASASVTVQNNGTGPGVQSTSRLGPAGAFSITNGTSTARAVDATTAGNGDAARVTITNQLSAANALWSRTFGLGRAGLFEISNFNSTATALEARTDGTGLAGKFVGDVEMSGDVVVDGTFYAKLGNDVNRGAPIAYGRVGHAQPPSGSDNVIVETLSNGSSATWRVTVEGEQAPGTWIVVANVTYSDPESPTRIYSARTSPPDAFGRFKIHLQCESNCDVFSTQTYGVSFVVYRP